MPPNDADKQMDADQEERQALGRVAHALRHYRSGVEPEVARWERNLSLLSPQHRALVPRLPEKIAAARQCIYRNQLFINAMLSMFVEDGEEGLAPPHLAPASAAADEYEAAVGGTVAPHDLDKARYVLKNIARDWSEEGAAERAQSYGRILRELRRLFAGWPAGAAEPPSVLVPGAGLARLCLEVVDMGFQAQGNEFSYFMLLTSAYLLNGWTIHPWCHNSCNQLSTDDQLRGVQVPDVHPAALVPGPGLLSMSAGDFGEVYRQPEYAAAFDAVAACFFLDTAHNVLEYLEVIWHTLRPGGYLVSLGPLLYHWADARSYLGGEQLSVELSLEEVKAAALALGFRLVREEMVEAGFLANPRSMMQASTYRCAFWTLQKPGADAGPATAAGGQQESAPPL
ncbi:hypothetical protein CHLNCDRAFT_142741 [Chlorella variabilis]|uniref:carnosine N-methyltransferase n=1 Tax=Chlorella variabilis TaxID=554065 RepID=E1Z8M4_CHLVA|nr:hypothetical protein CHLNCDRAFT_142741 [Chlorella variabilis]EFN57363.1 hypothetical protein CHLNCDRAFT_142741 [Chlorella variabilis]|eukprot:XP_005849465.1 hypothetical protein CHLNCDRAFT_142741 [Chlorella variabilis]